MGHDEFIAANAIQARQQPAAQTLLQRVMPVAHRRLRHPADEGLRIAQQQVHRRPGLIELCLDRASRQS
jgi:hypothetical protein